VNHESKTAPLHPLLPLQPPLHNPQVFHLFTLHAATGIHVENVDLILEFGGGYGCLCRAAFQAGFTGQYVIFDLPVFSAVQTFYLRSNGIAVRSLTEASEDFLSGLSGVYTLGDVDLLGRLVQDHASRNGEGGSTLTRSENSVVFAMWSLCEAPLWAREGIWRLRNIFNVWMLGCREEWQGVDNMQYVRSLALDLQANSTLIRLPDQISAKDFYFVASRPGRDLAAD